MLPPRLPALPPSPVRLGDLILLAVLVVVSVFAIPLLLTVFRPETDFAALPVTVGLLVGQSVLMLFFTYGAMAWAWPTSACARPTTAGTVSPSASACSACR